MMNWRSNVFPGILGRTCDRPCEPACRRGRVEETPVAICRLKRVAADFKDDVKHRMPRPSGKNGKRTATVGGGPASLTVATDLAPLGYHCTVFDSDPKAGGMMRTQIPKFRLPDSVIDEETDYILNLGIEFKGGQRIDSLKQLLGENYDAIFVGSGAPRGRELDIPGRKEAGANIHIGIEWLASVSFGHVEKIGRRVIVLGGGNTAMDCCRTARRLGGEDVKVIGRSGFEEMKASPGEKEDAIHEDIPILNLCSGEDITERRLPDVEISSQKMGIHEWSYDNDISGDKRYKVPHRDKVIALKDIRAEVELGYDVKLALGEAQRCLNCDIQTVFTAPLCIECDACVDICPMDCITFTENGDRKSVV